MTRADLRNYRKGRREAGELRARARQAQLRALQSGLLTDRDAAAREEARYAAEAERREAALDKIEREICALRDPDERRACRMFYVDGRSQIYVSQQLGVSEKTAWRIIARATRKITGGQ